MTTETVALLRFVAYCRDTDMCPIEQENAILSIGREYLPACARAVLDNTAKPTAQYYYWLLSQTDLPAEELA